MASATLDHATCNGHIRFPATLIPTPPSSADSSHLFIPSPPKALRRRSHYQTFSQAQLLTPPPSAELPPEHDSAAQHSGKLHRVSSHFQIPKSVHSLHRPVSTMGFIGLKKEKEKLKEEKRRGKGKEKEKRMEHVLNVEDGDGILSSSKFSLSRSSSSTCKEKPLKKKRSVARLLKLAGSGPPPTFISPPSPIPRLHVYSVSTAELLSTYHEEKPVPLVIPVVPNDEECDENVGAYAYAVEHRDAHFATKYITKDRWHIQNNMKMHPYGDDAVYMQSYEHMSLNNDRHFNLLLRRINPNGSPSFHDYTMIGETIPRCALDLACGQGHWVLQAAVQWPNTKIVGFDLVDVALPQVFENENITFVRGNFLHYALPFPPQSFDYVRIANASLAIPYEKWEFVLKEVQRVLTRGGRLEVIDDQLTFPYADQRKAHHDSVPASTFDASQNPHHKRSPSFSTLDYVPSPPRHNEERGFETENHDIHSFGNNAAGNHVIDGDANADVVAPVAPEIRRRCSSLPLGPRPNVRPLSMSAETWRKRLGIEEDQGVRAELPSLSPVSDSETELESEPHTPSPENSSSEEEEDYGQEVEVKIPVEGGYVPSPSLLGPRPNARPMSMNAEKWKDRLNFSLWNNTLYEYDIPEGLDSSSSEESGETNPSRISSSSTINSSEWSFSVCSTASTASTAPSSVVDYVEVTRPARPTRPLPSPPPQCEEEIDTGSVSEIALHKSGFVSSPDDDEDDEDFFPEDNGDGACTPSVQHGVEEEYWQTQTAHSREIETVFNDMLLNKYGVDPEPCTFLASAMQQVFGADKAGRVRSMHLMLAPEEFQSYLEAEMSLSEVKKEKKGTVRWSDELENDSEKDKQKVFGMTIDRDKKEKHHQRARALTEPTPRNSNDSAASLSLPPGLSAKAALRLGITYTALANAAAESRSTSNSPSASSSSSNLASPTEDANKCKQSPGLLLWPSTLIPMSAAELEMHACKSIHDVLGCKPALAEWVSGYVDENGERVVSDEEFEDAMWEYECCRRKRLKWPETLPETNMDVPDLLTSLITPKTNIEVPSRQPNSHMMSDSSSTCTDATVTPTLPQVLAGGVYAKEDLTHVRTIRVYEAVKSWRKSPLSDNNKTPTSASPPSSAA
ncbi:hypothetical protein E1B28_001605 [Marasmius oreades]|uniref:Methyltransferase domain-containing protein n=1 Tax=Marasmius oreades TaxID=181124 RepID=A0A9P8AFQ6_9AGAR|nr:uncharacterized protein E1B28_001605 [Marasmius oreades]KAG7099793.1 hypothetical protein E1B28_001605 [Marasmius oreades]